MCGQRYAVNHFGVLGATLAMSTIELVMTVAIQEGWPLHRFDVAQAFVRAKMDTNGFMKLPDEYDPLRGDTVRLERSMYGAKKVGRQWHLLLNNTLMEDAGMARSTSDPCVYKQVEKGHVCVILVVHFDDILIGKETSAMDRICDILNEGYPTSDLGEVQWYAGCAVERDWTAGAMFINQTTFVDTLLKRYDATDFSRTSALVSADLNAVRAGDAVQKRPCRSAVGGLMWSANATRLDTVNAARNLVHQSHDSCERHWR